MTTENKDFKDILIPKEIFLDKRLNWNAKIIFIEIDSFTKNNKDCFISNSYLADFLNISETQVSKYISLLKKLGYITEVSFDGRKRVLKSNLKQTFLPKEVEEFDFNYANINKNLNQNVWFINKNTTKKIGINETLLLTYLIEIFLNLQLKNELIKLDNSNDLYFIINSEKIKNDTTLTYRIQKPLFEKLIKFNLIKIIKKGLPCKNYCFINFAEVKKII